jgi:predicted nucleic acid-binding protein
MDSLVSRLIAATNAGPLFYLSVLGRLSLSKMDIGEAEAIALARELGLH